MAVYFMLDNNSIMLDAAANRGQENWCTVRTIMVYIISAVHSAGDLTSWFRL